MLSRYWWKIRWVVILQKFGENQEMRLVWTSSSYTGSSSQYVLDASTGLTSWSSHPSRESFIMICLIMMDGYIYAAFFVVSMTCIDPISDVTWRMSMSGWLTSSPATDFQCKLVGLIVEYLSVPRSNYYTMVSIWAISPKTMWVNTGTIWDNWFSVKDSMLATSTKTPPILHYRCWPCLQKPRWRFPMLQKQGIWNHNYKVPNPLTQATNPPPPPPLLALLAAQAYQQSPPSPSRMVCR